MLTVVVAVTSVAGEPSGEEDDLGGGSVEPVQAADTSVRVITAVMPRLRAAFMAHIEGRAERWRRRTRRRYPPWRT